MNKKELAAQIIGKLGNSDNIVSVAHCMTRLRITIKDESRIDEKALSKLDGVLKVLKIGDQYQIVLGGIVDEVFDEFTKLCRSQVQVTSEQIDENLDNNLVNNSAQKKHKESWLGSAIDVITSIVAPVLPALLGCSFITAVAAIATNLFDVSADNSTIQILNAVGNTLYGFFPIIIGWSAAKRFKTNIGVSLVITGLLVYSGFTGIFETIDNVTFLGVPVANLYYGSSVLPAVLTVLLQSYFEKWLKKVIPDSMKSIFVPFLTMLIIVPVEITVIGPIGYWGGAMFARIFTKAYEINPALCGAIVGGTWQILIIVGMHIAILGMVSVPNIAATGRDNVIMTHAPSLMCQIAAGLAVALISKKPENKKNAFVLSITSLFAGSVIEPVMYGVNLKYKKPFIAVCIGGAVGGAIAGAAHAGTTAAVALSPYTWPVYLGEGFGGLMIGCAVGAAITFVLTCIMGIDETVE